jgi:hypothetical protein
MSTPELGQIVLRCHELLDQVEAPCAATLTERLEMLLADYQRLLAERRTERPPRERLLEVLVEDRSEVLMMLADACLDEGRPEEARGWGWLGQAGKWPVHDRRGWYWHLREVSRRRRRSYVLPATVFGALRDPKRAMTSQRHPTARAALEAAVATIALRGVPKVE